jgi:hypothetical protein
MSDWINEQVVGQTGPYNSKIFSIIESENIPGVKHPKRES